MKMKFIYLLLIVMPFSCRSQSQDRESKMDIGAIRFDPKTDNSNFFLCDSTKIYEYYNFELKYLGEKVALKDTLFYMFKLNGTYKNVNGIITIRFVVNCKGETDRFRVKQVDTNYKEIIFSEKLVAHLLAITKQLDKWQPGKRDGKAIDSYVHVNYLFENGILKHITP